VSVSQERKWGSEQPPDNEKYKQDGHFDRHIQKEKTEKEREKALLDKSFLRERKGRKDQYSICHSTSSFPLNQKSTLMPTG
jgi:hypothetical protein